MKAKVVHLDQRSDAWHEWRRRHIGASEIAAVLGISPWATARDIWERKTGRANEDDNPAMARGRALEASALMAAEVELGVELTRGEVLEAEDEPLAASLDGRAGGVIVEIKCPASLASYERHRAGVPEHYMAQIQQQLMLARAAGLGGDKAVLYVWHPDAGSIVHEVEPSDEWTERIITAARAFWARVEADEWEEDDLAALVQALAAAKAAEAEAIAARKRIEEQLMAAMRERGAKRVETIAGIRATLAVRKTVDREALQSDPDWQALQEQLKPLEARRKEIEARYKTRESAYIRVSGV